MQPILVAGDTLDFLTSVTNYPPADGWTLKFRLVPRTAGNGEIDITATTSGSDYRVQVAPSVTALWDADEYSWNSWVEKTGVRYSVESGQVTIKTDPSTLAAGTDSRSQAEQAVDDLKAAYATYTSSQGHIAEYEIAGRRMKFANSGDIIAKLSFWQAELTREKAQKAVAAGLPDPRRIYLRAGRA